MTQSYSRSMSSEGIEYELMDFLLMSTQDELNVANALQSELDANARFMDLFNDDSPLQSAKQPLSSPYDEDDVTEDVIDGTLSASSFVAGWINQPTVVGCPNPSSNEYGRTHTDAEHAEIERQLKLQHEGEGSREIEGVLSWTNVTDQILTGLGLRQKDDGSGDEDTNNRRAAVVFGLNTPLTDSSNGSSQEGQPMERSENMARSKKSKGSNNSNAQDTMMPNDARDDSDARRDDSNDSSERSGSVSNNGVVMELVEKCLVSNNGGEKSKRRTRANSAGEKDSSSSIPQTVVVSSDNSTKSGGSKNEVIKKLAAKCLVMNKKSTSSEKLDRLPLEPDSHLVRALRPEEALVTRTTRRSKRMPLFQELHKNDDASVSISNAYFQPESRDPPIGPEIIPCDPPDDSSMQQQCLVHENIMHPPSHPRPENIMHYPQHLHPKWHAENSLETTPIQLEDGNPLGLIIDTDAPIYYSQPPRPEDHYSQPPRPETPFSGTPRYTEERMTPMNKLASPLPLSPNFVSPRSRLPLSPNFASPLSRHGTESSPMSRPVGSEDEKENNETFKERVLLSPSAAARRQHYKEMLLQERAAKKKASIG